MGAGKTTVGRTLATRLSRPFVDNDELLHRRTLRTAAEIESADGADALHREEARSLLDALASGDGEVLAAAASVVDDRSVRERLAEGDVQVVWLRAHPSTLRRRTLAGSHRPFVKDDPAAVARLDGQRRDAYAEVADAVVDVDDRAPDDIVDELARALA